MAERPVVVERRVAASPSAVYAYLTRADRWVRWQGALVRLTHRQLPAGEVETHAVGWRHYLGRLALVAAGADPGPDGGPAGGTA